MRRITPKRYIAGQLREKIEAARPARESHQLKEKQRLGDRIGSALESIGVTPERWQALKGEIGLPPTCNCEARKAWLNELDKRLSLSERLERFVQAVGWK